MKKFKILNIVSTTMTETNQNVVLIELSELKVETSTRGDQYSFDHEGEAFVFDRDCKLTRYLIESVEMDRFIELDFNEFVRRSKKKNGRPPYIYYHNTVHLVNRNDIGKVLTIYAEKEDNKIYLDIPDRLSIAQVDIALKDICIFLRMESKWSNKYISSNNGYLQILVRQYSRELSDEEQSRIYEREMPINEVIVEYDGFGFDEIKDLMHDIQRRLPDHFKSRFMYSVDFKKLSVLG